MNARTIRIEIDLPLGSAARLEALAAEHDGSVSGALGTALRLYEVVLGTVEAGGEAVLRRSGVETPILVSSERLRPTREEGE